MLFYYSTLLCRLLTLYCGPSSTSSCCGGLGLSSGWLLSLLSSVLEKVECLLLDVLEGQLYFVWSSVVIVFASQNVFSPCFDDVSCIVCQNVIAFCLHMRDHAMYSHCQQWFVELPLYFGGIPRRHLQSAMWWIRLVVKMGGWLSNHHLLKWRTVCVSWCEARAIVFCVKCTLHCLCFCGSMWLWPCFDCTSGIVYQNDCISLAHQRTHSVFSFSALICRVVTIFWGHTSSPLTAAMWWIRLVVRMGGWLCYLQLLKWRAVLVSWCVERAIVFCVNCTWHCLCCSMCFHHALMIRVALFAKMRLHFASTSENRLCFLIFSLDL